MNIISNLTQKISVLFVLAMFIVSMVPLAFAQEDNNDVRDGVSDNDKDNSGKTRLGLGDIAREKAKALREQVKGLGEDIRVEAKTLRELQRELISAKERYKNAHDEYFRLKGNVTEDVRLENARSLGIAMVERMLKHVEEAIQRIKDSTFDKEKKEALIERLENRMSALEDYKEKVNGAETMQELREVLHNMKKDWNMARDHLLEAEKHRVEKGFDAIIKKMDNLVNRIDSKIEDLREDGVDTESLDKKLEEINGMIAQAKVMYEELKELKSDDASREEIKEKFKELKAHLKETSQELKELVSELRELVKEEKEKLRKQSSAENEEDTQAGEGLDDDNENDDTDDEETNGNETDEDDNDEKEELKVEISGDVELSESAKALLDELTASFESVEGEIELKFKVENNNNTTNVEKDEVEGELSAEQQLLWDQIKQEALLLMSAQGDDIELEIEVKYESGDSNENIATSSDGNKDDENEGDDEDGDDNE